MLEPPDGENWTCEVRLKGARVPEVGKLRKQISAMGVGASLRGVEITLEGELAAVEPAPRLRVPGTGEVLRLAPIQRSLRWNPETANPRKLPSDEREACDRIRKVPLGSGLRVTGSLVDESERTDPVLQLRWFKRLARVKEL